MLIERLRQDGKVPEGTPARNVRQLQGVLLQRLLENLEQYYVWNAVCTRAVEAGRWGGERRRKQRLRLRSQIQACAAYLGEDDPTEAFQPRWECTNLIYGYGAMHELQARTGLDTMTLCILAPRTK